MGWCIWSGFTFGLAAFYFIASAEREINLNS